MSGSNQKNRVQLVIDQDRRNADIQCALLNVKKQVNDVSLVDRMNVGRFTEAGRQSRRPLMPFVVEHEMLCSIARAATRDGRPAVQAAVRDAVRAYFDKRCADVLSELPPETEADIVTAYLAETESQCQADPLQAAAATRSDCAVTVERSVERSRSYRRKLDAFIAAGERKATELRQRFSSRPSHLRVWT